MYVGLAHVSMHLRKLITDARLHDRLNSKGCVPALGSVVSLHLHAILSNPEVVVQARNVPVE